MAEKAKDTWGDYWAKRQKAAEEQEAAPATQEAAGSWGDYLTGPLQGAKEKKIEIRMLEETYDEVMRLAAESHWKEDEALLIVLANGLAYIKGERALSRAMDNGSSLEEELRKMTELYMRVDSMYATMKFRAYHLAEDRQILEFQVAGLRPDNDGMRRRIFQYKEEVQALKAEIARLKEENQQLRTTLSPQTPQAAAVPQRHRTWLGGWILRLLGQAGSQSRGTHIR